MKFNIITLFPEEMKTALTYGVVGQALKKGLLDFQFITPREYTSDFHKTVDDRPFGGGDGMVLLAEPLSLALTELKEKKDLGKVVYMSPQGRLWSDSLARSWAEEGGTRTLICGRYGGIDQRVIQKYVDEEISIGDYILSGGEVAAQVVVDSSVRFLPGVLGNTDSPDEESFSKGLLEAPMWTRPREWEERKVPDFLLSGHHKDICEKRHWISLLRTKLLRPEIFPQQEEGEFSKALSWFQSLNFEEKGALGFKNQQLEEISSWSV